MRNFLLLFLFLPLSLFSQKEKSGVTNLYGGMNIGVKNQIYVTTVLEHRDEYLIGQIGYHTNFNDENLLFAKVGVRVLNKKDFQWYVYILPYLNLSLDEKKYNTPLSTEVFYKDNLSLVLDGYKNGVFPSLRWRVKIL